MKAFIIRLGKFCFPFVIILTAILVLFELLLVNKQSSFQLKSSSYLKYANKTELVVFGSSHNQSAVNPYFIDSYKSVNLAFGGQDPSIDSALLDKCIRELPKLKIAVFDLYYHSLDHRNGSNYFRNTLYLKFFDINLFKRETSITDHSIFLSNPRFYLELLNPLKDESLLNEYGFVISAAKDDANTYKFWHMKFNELNILKDSSNYHVNRHRNESINNYYKNCSTYRNILKRCRENNIIPIFISTPVYKTYLSSFLQAKNNRRLSFIDELKNEYPELVFLNYESFEGFFVTDFKDDDHLNPNGSKKLTNLLNSNLKEIIKK